MPDGRRADLINATRTIRAQRTGDYTLTEPELIDTSLLDATTAGARESPRGCNNHNFHTPDSDAVEPGS